MSGTAGILGTRVVHAASEGAEPALVDPVAVVEVVGAGRGTRVE